MKNIIMILSLLIMTSTGLAATSFFTCTTDQPLEQLLRRKIEFGINDVNSAHPSVYRPSRAYAFKISPKSQALRALNTGDNGGVSATSDRIEIYMDEVGMSSTILVLWKNVNFTKGYVRTGGEDNLNLYSKITCSVK